MEKLLQRTLKHPIVVLISILAVSGLFFVAMTKNSRMETDLDKYMPLSHPAFVYSNQAEEWFNIKDNILIAIENPDGVYNPGTLQKIKDVTKALQKMKEIKKADVTSLYTADNIIGTEEGMDVAAFYKKVPTEAERLEKIRRNVRDNEMVYKRLVSEDETVTVVSAKIGDDVFSEEFYQRIMELAKSFSGPEKLYVAGTPIVEGALAYLGPKDMQRMIPIVSAVIILVLYFTLRSVKNTIFTLLVVMLSTIWAFGLMAVLNIPIYAVSTMLPVMLIAIGVADGIHLYSHLDIFLQDHPQASRTDAVKEMLHEMWKPVVMTSVTTAVGFVSLVSSQVYAIKYFGLFTAFGVMAAMLFSLILIPAGILVFGFPARHHRQKRDPRAKTDSLAYTFAEKIVKYKVAIAVLTVIIVGVSLSGIPKIWINSSFLDKFERNSDIVLTDAFINEHFGGTNSINVVLEGKEKDAFKQPDALRLIDRLQDDVEQLALVGSSFSLADFLKRMNKVMNADDEAFNTIPDSPELIAQYLLLYEMSGDPENLWEVVDYGYQKANVMVQIKSDNSKDIKEVLTVLDQYVPQFETMGITINYAGSGYKALVFTELILQGQIISLVISLIVVILLLAIMFRKFALGVIGAIPIMITAVISFGLMGLLNIPLSTTTALISSIAIGIGIDYAVHFIERYKIYALETGDKGATIRQTMHHSGRAILFNAAVVIAGFLVLLFSVFPPNRALGTLVSLNMFTSFLGTVTIMFLVLYRSNIYFNTSQSTSGTKAK